MKYFTAERVRKAPIKEIDCKRETKASVYIKHPIYGERKQAKTSAYAVYRETWEECRQVLLTDCSQKILRLEEELRRAQIELERLKNLTRGG